MSLGNAGIVYGTRGEVFEGQRDGTLREFIASTFNIDNVFQTKLVMGRCICHGKKALETDMLLANEAEANKFISARESKKPHVILIYDKHGDAVPMVENKEGKQQNTGVVISRDQWDDLVSSLKKVEISLQEKEEKQYHGIDVVHPYVVCDGCYPTEQTGANEIRGPRFKCLTCRNFDLCSACESSGYENFRHKRTHNMVKVNTPSEDGMLATPVEEAMQPPSKVSSSDKEVVIDISGNNKELFDMFSKLESLEAIVHGYGKYKKWTEKFSDEKIDEIIRDAGAKPAVRTGRHRRTRAKQTKPASKRRGLVVEVEKKDNVMIFDLRNCQSNAVPGGLTFVCSAAGSASVPRWELPMGPHELLPGNNKVLKYNCYPEGSASSLSTEGRITLVDKQENVLYEGLTTFEPGSQFLLRCAGAEPDQNLQDLVLVNDPNSLRLLDKDDSDGVISSSVVTNDNETSRSGSSHETFDWEDYDFLSESDV